MELLERLAMHGVAGELRFVARDAHTDDGLAALVAAARAVDLLVIATPVYIDALPWLVTRALEAIAADRRDASAPPLTVVLLTNCGFPEAWHAAVSRTIAALFARDAHALWAGALQLGGGEVLQGRALAEAGGLVRHLANALDAAAEALACGDRLTDGTIAAFQQPLMPVPLYMAAGDAGWIWAAAKAGAVGDLLRKPAVGHR
jgi:hypothetical protein